MTGAPPPCTPCTASGTPPPPNKGSDQVPRPRVEDDADKYSHQVDRTSFDWQRPGSAKSGTAIGKGGNKGRKGDHDAWGTSKGGKAGSSKGYKGGSHGSEGRKGSKIQGKLR